MVDPQSQGSVERANGDVGQMLRAVLAECLNNEWVKASQLVQWRKNTVYHSTIKRTNSSTIHKLNNDRISFKTPKINKT